MIIGQPSFRDEGCLFFELGIEKQKTGTAP